jgi:hypothetical protein
MQLGEENIDRARELGTCGNCGNLIDLRGLGALAAPQAPAAPQAQAAPQPPRPTAELPKGLTVQEGGGGLVITRVWWRTKHVVMIAFVGTALVWTVAQWVSALDAHELPPSYVLIATPFVLAWDIMLTAMFITKTRITVGGGRLDVRTAPFPLAKNGSIATAELSQLFAVKDGPFYAVMAELRSGQVLPLLRMMKLAEHALAIEQRIEAALGIVDRPVEGELPKDGSAARQYASVSGSLPLGDAPAEQGGAVPQAPANASMGWIVIFPFGLAALGIGSMVYAFTAGVEGKLQARGALGDWAFSPDDCANGQTVGFFGVELKSEKDPAKRIRLMKDELGRPKIAVLVDGAAPVVIGAKECPGMTLHIVRTDDMTNGVYLMEGRVAMDCPALEGTVSYERCGL